MNKNKLWLIGLFAMVFMFSEARASVMLSQNYNMKNIYISNSGAETESSNYKNNMILGIFAINITSANYKNYLGLFFPKKAAPPEEEEEGGGGSGGVVNHTVEMKPLCGNKICDDAENWKNCEEDCKKPVEKKKSYAYLWWIVLLIALLLVFRRRRMLILAARRKKEGEKIEE